jgi:hypothetical protein
MVIGFLSCEKGENANEFQNLQEYINAYSSTPLGEVIACAASEHLDTDVTYVFYYPLIGATDISYFESDEVGIDPNDFSNYIRKELAIEPVFGGKLERFVRTGSNEAWGMVTFVLQGVLHRSNPIRLKNKTKSSEWTDTVAIDFMQSGAPKFSWTDGNIVESVIYFQVIADAQQRFFSGTYTTEKWYQYQNNTNVVLDINTEVPPDLNLGQDYNFTLMGVSEDNWVNLIIQKTFTAQ